jgi:uncharacterized protein (TIGR00255 family)
LPPGFEPLEHHCAPPWRSAAPRQHRRHAQRRPPLAELHQPRDIGAIVAFLRARRRDRGETPGGINVAPPRLDGLIGMRGVIETVEDDPEDVVAARRAAVLASWSVALDRLAAARSQEGARLAALLTDQRAGLESLVESAAASAAAQPAAIRGRLEALLGELSGLAAVPEERVAQELALLVTRADVREELDRLRAHIAQAGELLDRGDAIGRQLDFLCQELNREANTLCSKSADIELTRIGLSLKAAIEQFREQVQNLE